MRRTFMSIPLAAALFAATGAVAQDQVTLDFWEGHSTQEEAATIRMIEAFEASHPNIRINRVKTSMGTNFEAITTALASGTAPDVSPIYSGFLTQFAASGALVNLKDYGIEATSADIYPGATDYVTREDGIYGLPYAFDPRFIAYNGPALQEAGVEPAQTFEQLVEVSRQLAVIEDGEVKRFGFGLPSGDGLAYFLINAIYAYGGEIFNEDGTEVVFNSPEAVQAGQMLSELASFEGNTLNANGDTVRQGVISGRIAAVFDGPWVFYAAQQDPNSQPVEIGPMPVAQEGDAPMNFGSVGAYVVYQQSDNPEEAAEFVRFMASPEAQQYRVEVLKTGVAPGVVDEEVAKETFAQVPALLTAQQMLEQSRIFPKHDAWSRVFQAIIPAAEAIIAGEDPQAALDSAVREANRGLRRS